MSLSVYLGVDRDSLPYNNLNAGQLGALIYYGITPAIQA